eukprot:229491-Heterocapsa_arctica.AAC.1
MSLWDHFWVTFGIALGSGLGHFGYTLGSLWGHFGVTLGSLWAQYTLGTRWGHCKPRSCPSINPESPIHE